MNGNQAGVTRMRIASPPFADRDGLDAFRETICRPVLTVDIEPLSEAFGLDCTLHFVPGFAASFGQMTPSHWTHASAMAGTDDVIVACMDRGDAIVRQNGREASISDGSATLVADDLPGTYLVPTEACMLFMRFDRARLQAMSVDIGAALARPVPPDNAALRLLVQYASILGDDAAMANAELQRAVTDHLYELAALAFGAPAPSSELQRGSGVRAARLQAIKDHIRSNLADSRLSIHEVASRHGVTPRYVQMLFEDADSSYSKFVLAERLALARSLLRDPGLAARGISAIAYDAGFNDLSYFNRTFRVRYGMTPSDTRASPTREMPR